MKMDWILELDKITQDFEMHFSNLTQEELNWRPYPGDWSIAQNLEHLIIVNETYYPVLASLKNNTYKTPFIAKSGIIVSFLGKTVLKAVQPDRKEKMKTFPLWEPSYSEVHSDILLMFKNHQAELQQKIADSSDLVKKGVIISSPAKRMIVYKLETAYDIIVNHEMRHLEQAKEILRKLNK